MCTSSQNATNNLNLIIKENKEDLSDVQREREVMFEKKLTPSDVGKLNRLVIPKHHALTYFPLVSHDHGKSNVKKVTSLSFQDESGQWWRFRYSYWSSSQSYVLTKGWSRFVRQKQLHAGDVIYFQRQRMRWRSSAMVEEHDGVNRAQTSSHPNGALLPYQRLTSHAGMSIEYQSPQTSVAAAGESKRTMRLFGVDFECRQQDEPDEVVSTDGSFPSSQVQA